MTPEAQSMLEKVRKLLVLANDKGATDGERDNAMRIAHKLLAKHNLTMAQVEAAGQQGEKRIVGCVTFYGRPWAQVCAQAIAKLCFCVYLVGTAKLAKNTKHYFVGKESNSITAANMAQYIVDSIRRESKRRQRDADAGNVYARSFAMGAAAVIARRVEKMMEEAAPMRGDGKSIVLASVYQTELEANTQRMHESFELAKPKDRRISTDWDYDAAAAGGAYGTGISLNRQIESTTEEN